MVERGREAGDICGDVGKDLWRRLVIVTDLKVIMGEFVLIVVIHTLIGYSDYWSHQ